MASRNGEGQSVCVSRLSWIQMSSLWRSSSDAVSCRCERGQGGKVSAAGDCKPLSRRGRCSERRGHLHWHLLRFLWRRVQPAVASYGHGAGRRRICGGRGRGGRRVGGQGAAGGVHPQRAGRHLPQRFQRRVVHRARCWCACPHAALLGLTSLLGIAARLFAGMLFPERMACRG